MGKFQKHNSCKVWFQSAETVRDFRGGEQNVKCFKEKENNGQKQM
jgi:hypothetical protein